MYEMCKKVGTMKNLGVCGVLRVSSCGHGTAPCRAIVPAAVPNPKRLRPRERHRQGEGALLGSGSGFQRSEAYKNMNLVTSC